MFQKATRTKAKGRIALEGPSGSGKTFSALELATGLLAGTGLRIAMIDTERGSGVLYADQFDYDVMRLDPPFTPKKYIDAIRAAEQAGYGALIIDSLSHAWAGEGGILDIQNDRTKASQSGNGFQAWKDVTPQHERIVNAVLGADLHVIATIRTKTAYEIVENDRGKKEPRRIGLAPVQRQGLEYEFTCVFDLSVDSHMATASKDRSSLFDGAPAVITRETGHRLGAWLDSGAEPEERFDPYKELKKQIAACASMDELAKLWGEITAAERIALADEKDYRKDQLQEKAA